MVNQELQFLRQRNEQLEKAFSFASQSLKQQYKLWSNSRSTGALFSKAQYKENLTGKINSQNRAKLLPTTEQFISSVIDMLPAAVFVKDAVDLRFILWNRAAEKLVGVSAEEILGKSDYDLFPKEEADFFTERDREVLNSKQALEITEEVIKTKKGETLILHIKKIPILDIYGEPKYLLVMREDITERKLSETTLAESEAKFRNLVENANDAIYSLSREGIFTYLSPNFTVMFGYEVSEFLGESFVPIIHPEDVPTCIDFLNLIVKTAKKQAGLEVRVKCKDGTYRWIVTNTSPVVDASGQVVGFQGITRDIHERKKTEKDLLRISKAIESASDAIGIADVKGRSIYHNPAFIDLFGYTPNELNEAGGPPAIFTNLADAQSVFAAVDIGESWNGEITMQSRSGRLMQIELRGDAIKDHAGNLLGSVGIHTDITKRKQAEARLKEQASELAQTLKQLQSTQSQLIQSEKMSALGQLVAGVAHEINNPVNFIYANLNHAHEYTQNLTNLLQLYQKHYPNPVSAIQDQAKAIDLDFVLNDLPKLFSSMEVGAERIRQIVASLRTFSRLDEAELKAVDIHDGINSTLMILEHRLKAKANHPQIKVIKEYGDLPQVECYPGQLNQVFMNILTNAIDALEDSLASNYSPEIRIFTEMPTSNEVMICIADNGPGMSENVQQRLFDPFFTTKPVGKGTGMGLSISYQIVTERHRGSLKCVSSLGQGAELVMQIPIHQSRK